jgi:N-acetylglucosamine-6-sulfatase
MRPPFKECKLLLLHITGRGAYALRSVPLKKGRVGVRRTVILLASLALAVLLLSGASGSVPPTAAQANPAKPNFVFILADDMRKDDLEYMPKTRSLLGKQGMSFENAYVSDPLCCPSRATILRGQYAHNHGVWSNKNGPNGAWEGYENHGNEQDNLATRLDAAGYRTGLFGKYFNGYESTTVPPGWDRWFAKLHPTLFDYYNYDVNDDGQIKHFGKREGDYETDVLGQRTQQFIGSSVNQGEPFFVYVAPIAPHSPASPAARDRHAFDGERAPRLPSFDERDVSDEPPWIGKLSRLGSDEKAEIDARHEARVETLQALDDLVEGVVEKLRSARALDDTYVVFTSDNGYQHGEHRIPHGKGRPYEESIRVPLLVRGPGVQADSTTHKLALNTDFFPTFMDLAGRRTPEYVDGRSLGPVLEGSVTIWRTAILLENDHQKEYAFNGPDTWFYGIRTKSGKKYIEYESGFRGLYSAGSTYELTNSYDPTARPAGLRARLQALKTCAGATCREAEDGR